MQKIKKAPKINFEINETTLSWSQKRLTFKWWIIPHIVEDLYCIDVREVAYATPKKRWFGLLKSRLFIGTKYPGEDYVMKIAKANIPILFNSLKTNGALLFSDASQLMAPPSTESKIKKSKSVMDPSSLWVYDDVIIGISRSGQGRNGVEICRVLPAETRFYSTHRKLKYYLIPRNYIYFGYLDQIEIADLGEKKTAMLRKHLIENGAPFAQKPEKVFTSSWTLDNLLSPRLWFVRERVAFTKDAVIFQQRKLSGTELMYIPFNKITFTLAKPTLGFLPSRIAFLGEQNVLSCKKFNAKVQKQINEELKKHVEEIKRSARLAKASWLARMCGNFSGDMVACRHDGMAIVGRGEDHKRNFGFVPIEGIRRWAYIRQYPFSLVGTLWLEGDYGNIRKDQKSCFTGYVRDISIFKYRFLFFFKGWLWHYMRETVGGARRITESDDLETIRERMFGDESQKGSVSFFGSMAKKVLRGSINISE